MSSSSLAISLSPAQQWFNSLPEHWQHVSIFDSSPFNKTLINIQESEEIVESYPLGIYVKTNRNSYEFSIRLLSGPIDLNKIQVGVQWGFCLGNSKEESVEQINKIFATYTSIINPIIEVFYYYTPINDKHLINIIFSYSENFLPKLLYTAVQKTSVWLQRNNFFQEEFQRKIIDTRRDEYFWSNLPYKIAVILPGTPVADIRSSNPTALKSIYKPIIPGPLTPARELVLEKKLRCYGIIWNVIRIPFAVIRNHPKIVTAIENELIPLKNQDFLTDPSLLNEPPILLPPPQEFEEIPLYESSLEEFSICQLFSALLRKILRFLFRCFFPP